MIDEPKSVRGRPFTFPKFSLSLRCPRGQRVPSINHGGHVWKADNVSECDQDGEFHGLMERSHGD
jgi:hypothetical protein